MKQRINLYVDDLRDCPDGFELARTFNEAISFFDNFEIDILSLDHDLGEDTDGTLLPTGYDFVKWFCEQGLKVNKVYLHTDNPVGRENMYQTLLGARKRGFIDSDIKIYHYPITPNKYSG
ncbi:cyclic-phosphate processing receiver domain-containing protein [Psychrobacillus sp. L3]|uniref:cyclic-phosphate processing receiver domain-containing protein n=1 Tax=Psychrobacillus sp. L3 TaxID=3236891 RepID=UPI0036F20738